MDKIDYIKYMRKNWPNAKDEEKVFVPREVTETVEPLIEQHQLDKRAENGIISDAD